VSNAREVFADIDKALGRTKPPALEYLFVEPYSSVPLLFGMALCAFRSCASLLRTSKRSCFFLGVMPAPNSFGHATVRYTLPSGEQKVRRAFQLCLVCTRSIDIQGLAATTFVDHEHLWWWRVSDNCAGNGALLARLPSPLRLLMFVSLFVLHSNQWTEPAVYLFSTKFKGQGNGEQRGLYNRAMVSVRVEELPAENILKMHQYFSNLEDESRAKRAKFHIALGPIFNWLNNFLPSVLRFSERGNCARWTRYLLPSLAVRAVSRLKCIDFLRLQQRVEGSRGCHSRIDVAQKHLDQYL
jgi:hypothetical protein